jgi:phospholipid/cholesterol/gamma-HCH transport system permease protein
MTKPNFHIDIQKREPVSEAALSSDSHVTQEHVTQEDDKTLTPQTVTLSLTGDWLVLGLGGMAEKLKLALKLHHAITIDHSALTSLDTAGALLLRRVVNARLIRPPFGDHPIFLRTYEQVGFSNQDIESFQKGQDHWRQTLINPVMSLLQSVGRLVYAFWREFIDQSAFVGHVITLCVLTIFDPKRLRIAPLVNLMQRVGIEAIPIVILTNFFIGAVVAFLGVLTLQELGGGIFAVEMIGMSVLREFAPMITAVFMAGRSASSFAAEIGAMKMRQEIDAMRVMGIDPFAALVVPRVMAMLIMTPLITFVGALSGLLGGAMVVWGILSYGLPFFAERMLDYVPIESLIVGIIKTPFFAATIAIVGCRMGMTVKEDVVSLGRQVTTSVVHATFLIFMINAIFALLFREFSL